MISTLKYPFVKDITAGVMSTLSLVLKEVYDKGQREGEASTKSVMTPPVPIAVSLVRSLIQVTSISILRPLIPPTTASPSRVTPLPPVSHRTCQCNNPNLHLKSSMKSLHIDAICTSSTLQWNTIMAFIDDKKDPQ